MDDIIEGTECIKNPRKCYEETNISRFFKTIIPVRMYKMTGVSGRHVLTTIIVPSGTTVYSRNESFDGPMRVDRALVERQVIIDSEKKDTEVTESFSVMQNAERFVYETGKMVKPTLDFSKNDEQCKPGIHLFASSEICVGTYVHGLTQNRSKKSSCSCKKNNNKYMCRLAEEIASDCIDLCL